MLNFISLHILQVACDFWKIETQWQTDKQTDEVRQSEVPTLTLAKKSSLNIETQEKASVLSRHWEQEKSLNLSMTLRLRKQFRSLFVIDTWKKKIIVSSHHWDLEKFIFSLKSKNLVSLNSAPSHHPHLHQAIQT